MKISGSKRIAERYVKALFEVARQSAAVDPVERDLQSLGQALEASPEFRDFLVNPLLSHAARAEVMLAILAKLQVQQVTRQFIGMLIRQKRLPVLPEIIVQFSALASAARGELSAQIITAASLKQQEIGIIGDRLGKAYGRTMKLEVKQDPSLLGGVVVKIGSQQLDSSLAGKMRRLKNALQAA